MQDAHTQTALVCEYPIFGCMELIDHCFHPQFFFHLQFLKNWASVTSNLGLFMENPIALLICSLPKHPALIQISYSTSAIQAFVVYTYFG
jgi:hypothetical protein